MRGNAVMKAKRVTGPSAQRMLLLKVALERCNVKGCTERVLVTRNPTGVDNVRYCANHIGQEQIEVKEFDPRTLLKLPWQ